LESCEGAIWTLARNRWQTADLHRVREHRRHQPVEASPGSSPAATAPPLGDLMAD